MQAQHIATFRTSGDGSANNSDPNAPLDTGVRNVTYAVEIIQPGIRIREWFEACKKTAAEHRMRRSAYDRTLRALESMSDRDLADVGISRLSIKEIAQEAAYGDRR